ncbi:MAG: Fic family protein [Bacteroidetes bacterium]|nr:Fic family protein [Bacteroidota bacterium]
MDQVSSLTRKVDSLSLELNSLKPLKKEDEERLWKKFRLEWNYNSNHIEGNTLTYGQTELLLIFEKTTGDHEIREYEEMRAHDVALKLIADYAKDKSRELTEADVRELNKIILVRPFWSNAQTPDGQPTRKLIQPGEYKKEPNSVLLQSGEMFHYTSPEETPAKMKELIDWYRKAESEKKLHPAEIAAKLHYDFVRIHPFDDSNGRTSRLLMNFVLLRHDFPPVIIKSADKKGYLNALNKADVGDKVAFTEYIIEQLIWSLELSIRAAKRENIDEKDDIDKEIEVWKKGLGKVTEEPLKSIQQIRTLYEDSLKPLFDEFLKRHQKNFDSIFFFNQVTLYVDNTYTLDYSTSLDLEKVLLDYTNGGKPFHINFVNSWQLSYVHRQLKTSIEKDFYIDSILKIEFHSVRYDIFHNDVRLLRKSYSQKVNDLEISNIVNRSLQDTFATIQRNRQN